jgi:D-alanine-D-alanine ligase
MDVKALGKVAVLMGGSSAEREVSLMSGSGVLQALRRGAWMPMPSTRPNATWRAQARGLCRCFIALHGRHGEDGTVQGALELLGIPYTGSGVMASSMAMDKIMTKRIWRRRPAHAGLAHGGQRGPDPRSIGGAGPPMIVKPAREGSSIGLTKVRTPPVRSGLRWRPSTTPKCCASSSSPVTRPPARAGHGGARALPVIRIVAPDGNYDYQNKYFTDVTQYHCPSGLPAEEEPRSSASWCRPSARWAAAAGRVPTS